MSVGTADLSEAITTAWNASTLNTTFKALGGTDPVLEDQERTPKGPFPYCTMEAFSPSISSRMSADGSSKRHVIDVTVVFHVFARVVSGDDRTAKKIAADLAEEVMKVFGGHATISPTGTIALSNGNHLITQKLTDYGIRAGDDEYEWVINYLFRLDVPVAV